MGTKVTLPDIEQVDNSSGLAVLNSNLDILSDEFDKAFYRDGSQAMSGTVDMDSNRIINLNTAVLATEPVILSQLAEYAQFDNIDALNAAVAQAEAAVVEATAAAESAVSVANTRTYSLTIVSHGQSLGKETFGPEVSTSYHPKLLQFNGGHEYDKYSDFTGNDVHWQDPTTNCTSLIPFTSSGDDTEGWGPGLGSSIGTDPFCDYVFFNCTADGSRHYRELLRGTGRYQNLVTTVDRSKHLLTSQEGVDESTIKPVLIWTQGEADADTIAPGGGTSEAVVSAADAQLILERIDASWRLDLEYIYGQQFTSIPTFITPLNSQRYDQGSLNIQEAYHQILNGGSTSALAILPPHYQFWEEMNTDGIHLLGQGRRYYAELAGNIIKRTIIEGLPYTPVRWNNLEASGNSLILTYETPDNSNIVIDETTFADAAIDKDKLGFEFYDDSAGAYVDITSITVSGKKVTINLPVTPQVGSDYLHYAQQDWSGTTGANTLTPRGNIRCGLSYTAEDDTELYLYALPQRETI